MSQGFASNQPVSIDFADGHHVDAFGRLRTAMPSFLFDSQLTYDLAPLIFEQIIAGSGAAIAHDTTNSCATMTFAATPTGGSAYMQSFEHIRYQPGRSQQIFISFNFISAVANCLKFVGYSNGTNGIELQQSGTTVRLALLSGTGTGNQVVNQASWNIDKLDGTGPSGLTLDLAKIQILVIDFQALYSGRVRVGFDINGGVVHVHQFVHSNMVATPYIQTANLPVRCGMTCTGTVSTTMRFICSSVSHCGGQEDLPGYVMSVEGAVSAGNGTRTHILSVRPKATFNSIVNRTKFVLEQVNVVSTNTNPLRWELCLGQALSGTTTFADVNTAYSAIEYNTAGALSGSPAIVIGAGYSGNQQNAQSINLSRRYPITLNAAGAVRSLGTLSVDVTGLTGIATTQVALNWREVR